MVCDTNVADCRPMFSTVVFFVSRRDYCMNERASESYVTEALNVNATNRGKHRNK